jgi:hypothetical protein
MKIFVDYVVVEVVDVVVDVVVNVVVDVMNAEMKTSSSNQRFFFL